MAFDSLEVGPWLDLIGKILNTRTLILKWEQEALRAWSWYIYIKEKNNEKLSYGFEDVKGVTLILVGEIMELC
jgi:uncharacterized protein YdeI (YjbR/CyaY-like superfamily)